MILLATRPWDNRTIYMEKSMMERKLFLHNDMFVRRIHRGATASWDARDRYRAFGTWVETRYA